MRDASTRTTRLLTIGIVGNPNSGKSTLFNALTGLRQRVGNYPGVTVERREGRMLFDDGSVGTAIDLPGTYSLVPASPDEQVAVDVLLGHIPGVPAPDRILCVVDAANLERNLYLASQIIDRGIPLVIALNMVDVAEERGIRVHADKLSTELGVPVVPTVASRGTGIAEVKKALGAPALVPGTARQWRLPETVARECNELVSLLRHHHSLQEPEAFNQAVELLSAPPDRLERPGLYDPAIIEHVRKDHAKLEFLGFDRSSMIVHARYAWLRDVVARVSDRSATAAATPTDRLDRVITHRIWGPVIFFAVMAMLFHSVFSWAAAPMEWIGDGFDVIGAVLADSLPPGPLREMLVNGALAGVAAVVTFLPQIVFLFLFLGVLEDSGYMARAAYVMDRMMSRVGLHGKSFIPLLSSFACAIPGIMATRTIDSPRDRIITMLVAPLMSCSARLPVYALLISAFIPATVIAGVVSLQAVTLMGLYLFGMVAALGMAWLFKKTILPGAAPSLILELPPYRVPSLRQILIQTWGRAFVFLKNAGTIILAASIVLWFFATYPRLEGAGSSERLQHSYAGRAGKLIEPVIRPLGFDWKIGIGLVTSLLQREVFVGTMGTIYNIEGDAAGDGSVSLQERLRADRDSATGKPTFTILTVVCVMLYYVLAMQCLSTVAVMRRETGGWKWPLFQVAYMTALAYGVVLVVYQAGTALGWG